MAAATKVVFLAIVFATVFLQLDGVDGLGCYFCSTVPRKEKDESRCNDPKSDDHTNTCDTGPHSMSCRSTSTKNGFVTRGCTLPGDRDIPLGECRNDTRGETCVCGDEPLCNSQIHAGAGYLHGTPLFAFGFGLILFTLVSNLGRQHLN